jgi:CheY-like chemotaxis protein
VKVSDRLPKSIVRLKRKSEKSFDDAAHGAAYVQLYRGFESLASPPFQSTSMAIRHIADAGDRSLILILSDINMPGMSGLELLPKVSALRPDVQIIIITGCGDAETKRRALENGAEAPLTKVHRFRRTARRDRQPRRARRIKIFPWNLPRP